MIINRIADKRGQRPPPDRRGAQDDPNDTHLLALVKGSERYVFLYRDDRRAEALRTLGRFASNPALSFTWADAAVLSMKIRQSAEEPT